MRVLIADDQPQVRSALRLLLMHEQGVRVVGEAGDAEQALELAAAQRPDLVLLDWELPAQGTPDPATDSTERLLLVLRARCPRTKVVALSGRPEARQAALAAGADAFVSKGDPPERLLAAVDDCMSERCGQSTRKTQ